MKHILHSFIFAFSLPLLLSCSSSDEQEVLTAEENTEDISILVNKIANCSKMYTAEVQLHKVFVAEDPSQIELPLIGDVNIPLGERKIAIPMNATVKAYIDLSTFSKDNVKIDGKSIIIELPKPEIALTSTEIDHDEVKKNVSLLRSNFTDKEISAFSKRGREDMIKAVPKTGIIEKAQSGAAAVIVPMLQQLGYKDKDIRVVFDNSVTSDPASFIKKNLAFR